MFMITSTSSHPHMVLSSQPPPSPSQIPAHLLFEILVELAFEAFANAQEQDSPTHEESTQEDKVPSPAYPTIATPPLSPGTHEFTSPNSPPFTPPQQHLEPMPAAPGQSKHTKRRCQYPPHYLPHHLLLSTPSCTLIHRQRFVWKRPHCCGKKSTARTPLSLPSPSPTESAPLLQNEPMPAAKGHSKRTKRCQQYPLHYLPNHISFLTSSRALVHKQRFVWKRPRYCGKKSTDAASGTSNEAKRDLISPSPSIPSPAHDIAVDSKPPKKEQGSASCEQLVSCVHLFFPHNGGPEQREQQQEEQPQQLEKQRQRQTRQQQYQRPSQIPSHPSPPTLNLLPLPLPSQTQAAFQPQQQQQQHQQYQHPTPSTHKLLPSPLHFQPQTASTLLSPLTPDQIPPPPQSQFPLASILPQDPSLPLCSTTHLTYLTSTPTPTTLALATTKANARSSHTLPASADNTPSPQDPQHTITPNPLSPPPQPAVAPPSRSSPLPLTSPPIPNLFSSPSQSQLTLVPVPPQNSPLSLLSLNSLTHPTYHTSHNAAHADENQQTGTFSLAIHYTHVRTSHALEPPDGVATGVIPKTAERKPTRKPSSTAPLPATQQYTAITVTSSPRVDGSKAQGRHTHMKAPQRHQ
ncbi:hypothetical protein BC827DRAFT_1272073 [Russula dissimulans]|nr:hypothetical protein BC827DRAFT_1272073 [Russula dissimulans]